MMVATGDEYQNSMRLLDDAVERSSLMTISDIIEIIVVCALIFFSRWAIWRGTLCDAFATLTFVLC